MSRFKKASSYYRDNSTNYGGGGDVNSTEQFVTTQISPNLANSSVLSGSTFININVADGKAIVGLNIVDNFNVNNKKIINVGYPTGSTDVVNRAYVDTKMSIDGVSGMSGAIDMNDYGIHNLGTPFENTDVSTKAYVDTKLNLNGGTMANEITMGGNKIIGLGSAVDNGNAANYGQLLFRTKLNDVLTTMLFGDGSDGDAVITGSITLTKNTYYDNLTISGSGYINTAGYCLYCHKLDLTNAGTGSVRYDGNNGGDATGATGGTAGAAITGISVGNTGAGTAGQTATTGVGASTAGVTALAVGSGGYPGGNGGAGGLGDAGAAASGGGNSTVITSVWLGHQLFDHHLRGLTLVGGGTGGRGGSAGSGDGVSAVGGGGGGAGGGGPYLWLSAQEIVTSNNTAAGAIRAIGGSGGNGAAGAVGNTGGGGGGGGGAGGRVDLRYQIHKTHDAIALIFADGGNGGAPGEGSGTGAIGTSGLGGTGGRVSICNTNDGDVVYTTQTLAPNGSTGGQTRVDLAADATVSLYAIMAPEFNASSTKDRVINFSTSITDIKSLLSTATGNLWSISNVVDITNVDGIVAITRSSAYYATLPQAVRALGDGLSTKTLESFVIYQAENTPLYVIGNSVTGVQHGLYEVLERLGFTWYFPGSEWSVTPTLASHRLIVSESISPIFRRMFSWDTWPSNLASYPVENADVPQVAQETWNRRNKYTTEVHTAGHAWQAFVASMISAPGNPTVTDPLFWAEVSGSRVTPTNIANTNYKFHSTHYGTSSFGQEDSTDYETFDGTVRLFVLDRLSSLQTLVNRDPDNYEASGVSVMPSDGYLNSSSICECNKCINLLRNGPWESVDADSTVSDRVFTIGAEVANRMLGEVDITRTAEYSQANLVLPPGKTLPNADDLKDRYVLCSAIHRYTSPPNNVVKIPNNFVITVNAWDVNTSNLTKVTDIETLAAWGEHKSITSSSYILIDKNFTSSTGTGDMCEPTYSPYTSHLRRQRAINNRFEGAALSAPNSLPLTGWFSWIAGRQGWYPNTTANNLLSNVFTTMFGAASATVRTMFEEFWESHNNWETTDWQLTRRNIGRAYQLLATARADAAGDDAVLTRLNRLRWYVHYLRLVYEYDEQAFTAPDTQAHLDAANAVIRWAWCCHPYGLVDAYGIQTYRTLLESTFIKAALSANWSTTKSVNQSPWNGCTSSAAATRALELENGEADYIADVIDDIEYTRTTLIQPITSSVDTTYVIGTTFTNACPASTFFLAPGNETVLCKIGIQTTLITDTSTAKATLYDSDGVIVSRHDVPFPEGTERGEWYDITVDLGELDAGQYYLIITTMSASHYLRTTFMRKIPNATWGRIRQNLNTYTQYFWVPANTTQFSVEGQFFQNVAPIIKCENTVVAPTTRFGEYVIDVGAGQDSKIWSITNTRWYGQATTSKRLGRFLRLRGVPNLLSPDAAQVLTIA